MNHTMTTANSEHT